MPNDGSFDTLRVTTTLNVGWTGGPISSVPGKKLALSITPTSIQGTEASWAIPHNPPLSTEKTSPLTLQPVGNNVGIGVKDPKAKLDINGDVRINDETMWLRGKVDTNHGIGWYGYTRPFANKKDIDGPVVFGYSGGALGINKSGDQKIMLWWTPDAINIGNADNVGRLIVQGDGGIHRFAVDGSSGTVTIRDSNNNATITMDSEAGDIVLSGADCAEEFEISQAKSVEPGTVVVIDNEGMLSASWQAYDRRVAGVISGAGNYRPGITLDRKNKDPNRLPVALSGKVYCKVDAAYGRVEVGDLLTTSPTRGYAMKAVDHGKTLGAVIGKALREWTEGKGLIPILVALQ